MSDTSACHRYRLRLLLPERQAITRVREQQYPWHLRSRLTILAGPPAVGSLCSRRQRNRTHRLIQSQAKKIQFLHACTRRSTRWRCCPRLLPIALRLPIELPHPHSEKKRLSLVRLSAAPHQEEFVVSYRPIALNVALTDKMRRILCCQRSRITSSRLLRTAIGSLTEGSRSA